MRLYWVCTLFCVLIHAQTQANPLTQVVCKNETWKPVCGANQFLYIVHADYSRQDNVTCLDGSAILTLNCYGDVTSSVRSKCEGLQTCSLSGFSSGLFGIPNPCEGTLKYFNVTWYCGTRNYALTEKKEYVCDSMWIPKCQFGVLQINSASYGNSNVSNCNVSPQTPCDFDVTQTIVQKCDNQTFCVVNITKDIATLPNSCDSSAKYLTVDWQCKPDVPLWNPIPGTEDYSGKLNFVTIGDWGGVEVFPYTTYIQTRVAPSIAKIAAQVNSSFVISLGDNFYTFGVKSSTDTRWRDTWENVFTHESLQTPWYSIAGNHDWYGNVYAQLDYSKLPSQMGKKQWLFPTLSYDIVKPIPGTDRTVHFIFVDTFHMTTESHGSVPVNAAHAKYTLDWLNYTLFYSTSHWKFIMTHYPMYSCSSHGPNAEIQSKLGPILDKYKIDLYMTGHDHNQQHLTITNTPSNTVTHHFVIGGGHNSDNRNSNLGRLAANTLKFYHPPTPFSRVDTSCPTNVIDGTGYWTARCPLSRPTIRYAGFGVRNDSSLSCFTSKSLCEIDVTSKVSSLCATSSCIIDNITMAGLGITNNTCNFSSTTPNYLFVNWSCTVDQGGFAQMSLNDTVATVSIYNDAALLLYQTQIVKTVSAELPATPVTGFYPVSYLLQSINQSS
eukprot:TRINITY_DN1664_c0_g1_i3.p1 TRINITY_DN1664_c0_g1~~TRINITY_DN1664_c0_g1_i3.p1  ORF type:complete len:664 (-),score=92.60 TRINITY_DN1664_c0_g1_i3:623-2614(-)